MIFTVLISSLISMILFLLGVAFFIVTERKGLSMIQLRKGPNKVSFKALLQAVSDGTKLLSKGWVVPSSANKFLFLLGPITCFFLSYCLWMLFPSFYSSSYFAFSAIFFICVSCVNVYTVLAIGWSSNSQYAFLGSMRAVAQSISYEVSMSTLLFCPVMMVGSFELSFFRENQLCLIFIMFEVVVLWVISVLAETNRAPFDFVEGESELVSGYNVEFGGFGFALIALAEYGNIIFMSLLSGILFLGGLMWWGLLGDITMTVVLFILCYHIIWVRGAFPRFRYDLLMWFCWKVILPISLGLLLIYIFMSL